MTAVKIKKTIGYFDKHVKEPDLRELHSEFVYEFGRFAEEVASKRGYGKLFLFETLPDSYTPEMMLEDYNRFLYCIEGLLIYGKLPEACELGISPKTYVLLKDTINRILLKGYSKHRLLSYLIE